MVREWNYYNIIYGDGGLFEVFLVSKQKEGKANTPQQAGAGLACSFGPKGRGYLPPAGRLPSRHSPNIRASAAAWPIAHGNKYFWKSSCFAVVATML